MSTILITGVNGFIGSHIAERLSRDGHCVRGLVRRTSDLKFIEGMEIDLFCGDIVDIRTLEEPSKGAEVVVHVAGLASDWGGIDAFRSANVLGTQNAAKAALGNDVKRFVHISTTALHGFKGKRNMDESHPMPPTPFPYCQTKKAAEEWLFDYARQVSMEVVAVRPGNVYGPRDHTFIDKYLDALQAGRIGYVGGGRSWTCPTYVENLAEGIKLACFEPAAQGESFILTDGLKIDWRTFTEKFAVELGVKPPRLSVPFWPAYGAAFCMEMIHKALGAKKPPFLTRYRISNGGRDYHFSIEKAKRLLKYKPHVEFDEAVRRTVYWYRHRDGAQ